MNETLNTVRYLFDDHRGHGARQRWNHRPAATAPIRSDGFPLWRPSRSQHRRHQLPRRSKRRGPRRELCPRQFRIGHRVSRRHRRVRDACTSTSWPRRAYRRPLTSDEQSRFAALYSQAAQPQTVKGYQVTFTVRGGDQLRGPTRCSARRRCSGAGSSAIPRWRRPPRPVFRSRDEELATQLAFFLTDQPPDDTLLAAARRGDAAREPGGARGRAARVSDRARLAARDHRDVPPAQHAAASARRPGQLPFFSPALAADMGIESRKFLDNALWNGNLTDLLLSRTAFLNSTLAADDLHGSPPARRDATSFVQTTLPADQRSGLLTNAGFLTSRPHIRRRNNLSCRAACSSPRSCSACRHPGPDMPGVGRVRSAVDRAAAGRRARRAAGL